MTLIRYIAIGYMISLFAAAALNYIPGLTDTQGRVFGIFALDIFDDLLHLFSGIWAGVAAYLSHGSSKIFMKYFGILYFTDGLLGLITGSGYLDLGIVNYGWLDLELSFKFLANFPHLALGGFAVISYFMFGRDKKA